MGKRCGACQCNRPGAAGAINVHTGAVGIRYGKALRRAAEGKV